MQRAERARLLWGGAPGAFIQRLRVESVHDHRPGYGATLQAGVTEVGQQRHGTVLANQPLKLVVRECSQVQTTGHASQHKVPVLHDRHTGVP
ncbi:hypothetical protein GCM10008960_08120 [Deinococcus sedimenti]|uniref:Uncharacterized protein n=1 Tax=Deinococcus sedimenti TaxID=1867090 RepID=A0ABQ2S1S3_9DEIO|nr:hypothetical protein GCM10008960_08120 [Deinococcus sedimenti]